MRREVKAVKVRPFLKRTAFFLAAAAGSVMLLFVHGVSPAYGAQGSAAAEETEAGSGSSQGEGGPSVQKEVLDGLSELDFSQVERFLEQSQWGESGFSFEELLLTLLKGDFAGAFSQALSGLKAALFSELSSGTRLMTQVLLISMAGAVFSCFSDIFSGGQISETAFYVTFLLLFSLLAASFYGSLSIAGEAISTVLGFMKTLAPVYFMAVSFTGGGLSAAAGCEWMLLSITAVEWLLSTFLLPLTKVYILLVLAGHLTKEELFSRMTVLIKNIIEWSLKTVTGIVLGFQLLQGMVLPYADAIKNVSIQRLISVIPGIGQGASAISQMVLGSGILIKNTVGAAAAVVLILLTAVPLLKLLILMALYHGLAAVTEPVCDKRIAACISDMGKAHQILIRLVLTSAFLFIISIGVICMTSNTVYYAG